MWISLKDVKDFDVPIGAVVKSVDGLGMLLTDDQGQVRHKFPDDHYYNKCSNLIRYHQQALFENLLDMQFKRRSIVFGQYPIGQVPSLMDLN